MILGEGEKEVSGCRWPPAG